jgi:hypothetical protein
MLLEKIQQHEEGIREHRTELAKLKAAIEAYRGGTPLTTLS